MDSECNEEWLLEVFRGCSISDYDLSELNKMEEIKISSYRLSKIPEWIGSLCNLKSLSLRGCSNICSETISRLYKLSRLESLDLSSTNMQVSPRCFGYLRSLKKLYLSKNRITNFSCYDFDSENLEILDLSQNKLNHPPTDIWRLKALRVLILDNNPLFEIPACIGLLTSLEHLSLFQCRNLKNLPEKLVFPNKYIIDEQPRSFFSWTRDILLGEDSRRSLQKNRQFLTSLTSINISSTPLQRLPEWFNDLKSVKSLFANECENLENIMEVITHFKNIELVEISKVPVRMIPSEFGELTNLKHLKIAHCEHISFLPDSLSSLTSLENVDFSGLSIYHLPEWMGNLVSLKTLQLRQTTNLTEIPDFFQRLSSLRKLDIMGSSIEIVGEWIGLATSLEYIELRGSRLLQSTPFKMSIFGWPDSHFKSQVLRNITISTNDVQFALDHGIFQTNGHPIILARTSILDIPENVGNTLCILCLEETAVNATLFTCGHNMACRNCFPFFYRSLPPQCPICRAHKFIVR